MPRLFALIALLTFELCSPSSALACPDCAPVQQARALLHSEGAALQLLLLLPLPVVLGAFCAWLHRFDRLLAAGAMLGIGLGGFIDGIVLHQLLQWHSMLSSKVEPTDLVRMKYNMIWDGLFHVLTWLATAAGVLMLWRAVATKGLPGSGRALIGSMLGGWGLFNAVEGVLNHHIYGLHHVHPGRDELAWDIGFIAFGVLLIAMGVWLAAQRTSIRRSRVHSESAGASHGHGKPLR